MKAMNDRTVDACMISGAGQHHLVGRVGAVEQAADHLLVPRVVRRQQLAQPLHDAGAAEDRVQHAGLQPRHPPAGAARVRGQVAGRRRDQRTPRTRSPNSSGRDAARHMIVMPPIECPPSTTGPVGRQLVEHRGEVVAELVDGDLGLAPGRAAVPALVVADQPQLARGDPRGEQVGDVVPGRLGQRPAVGEDDGDRRVVGAVDRGVQLGAVGVRTAATRRQTVGARSRGHLRGGGGRCRRSSPGRACG